MDGIDGVDIVKLPAEAGVKLGSEMYFFSQYRNLLFRMNISDFHVELESSVPVYKNNSTEMFRIIRNWNDWLILVPSYVENVWAYNIKTKEWKEIQIKRTEIPLKFIDAVLIENNIYLIALLYPALVKINLSTFAVEYICGDIESKEPMQLTNCIEKDRCIYAASRIQNEIIQFDLDKEQTKIHRIGNKKNRYGAIGWDGESFWIAPGKSGTIVRWQEKEGEVTEYEVPEEIVSNYIFVGIVFDDERVVLMPHKAGKWISIKNNTLTFTESCEAVVFCETYDDGTVVIMEKDATVRIKHKGNWKIGKCEIERSRMHKFFRDHNLWDRVFSTKLSVESAGRDLMDFIAYISDEG